MLVTVTSILGRTSWAGRIVSWTCERGYVGELDLVWMMLDGAGIRPVVFANLHGGGSAAVMVAASYKKIYGKSVRAKSVVGACAGLLR